jgi:uncharacterized protein YqgC (DUF456 family)
MRQYRSINPTEPYYSNANTLFGPAPQGQMFGLQGIMDVKPLKLVDVLRAKDVNLWGVKGIGATSEEAVVGAMVGLTAGAIVAGLFLSYAAGRWIAAPIIEYSTGHKLPLNVKKGIGIATMLA